MVNSLFSPLSSVLLLHSLPLLSQTSPNYHTFSLHSASPNLSFNDPSNFPEACSWGLGWLHWRPQSVSSGTHSYLVIGFCVGSTLPGPNLRQVLVFSYFGSCGSVLPTFHSLCDYPYESWKPCACSSCIFDSTVFIGSHCVRIMPTCFTCTTHFLSGFLENPSYLLKDQLLFMALLHVSQCPVLSDLPRGLLINPPLKHSPLLFCLMCVCFCFIFLVLLQVLSPICLS